MSAADTAEAVVVTTTSGAVCGTRRGDVHAFLGVPYAAAPVGALRFAAPQPHPRWDGVRLADAFGPTAPQAPPATPLFPQTLVAGDDCLHVNVYTPSPGDTALPVLVWIHGGGYVMGSNADPWTQGARIAARGVVVVSINYRLGVDGFLPLRDAPSNRAVRDWVAALEWVQANVAAFGGNPSRVTIGGQSAGSAACLNLLADPRHSSQFHGVVAMSGVPFNNASPDSVQAHAEDFAQRLGVALTIDGIGSVPYPQLFEVQNQVAAVAGIGTMGDPLEMFFDVAGFETWMGPFHDNDVVPRPPLDAFAAGAGSGQALMIGSTAHEMDALVSMTGGAIGPDAAHAALIQIGLRPDLASAWAAVGGRAPAASLGAALTALSFTEPSHRVASFRFGATAPTFVYEYAWSPPTPIGAMHAIDLPYFFDNLDAEGAAMLAGGTPPQSLADDTSAALVRFVTEGDPGWTAYSEDDRTTMLFSVPSETRNDPACLALEAFAR